MRTPAVCRLLNKSLNIPDRLSRQLSKISASWRRRATCAAVLGRAAKRPACLPVARIGDLWLSFPDNEAKKRIAMMANQETKERISLGQAIGECYASAPLHGGINPETFA